MSRPKEVFFLALGHLANDSLYSSLPPLLPLLVAAYGLSTALVGAVPAIYMVVASFLQPIFGQIYDRRHVNWLMSLGLLMGGLSIMSIGYVGSYSAILAAATVGGLGSALFHPVATSLSSSEAGHGRASNVSLFMLGGNLGLAIGPLIIVSTVGTFSIRGTFAAVLFPAVAAAAAPVPLQPAGSRYPAAAARARGQPHDDRRGTVDAAVHGLAAGQPAPGARGGVPGPEPAGRGHFPRPAARYLLLVLCHA
ncbi:MAG: MFS transporter, partial [Nitrososphaerota archaeon]